MREMKNSGIEWIGDIPSEWETSRLQWLMYEIKESNNPIKTTQVLSLTNKLGVVPYEDKGNQGNKAKEDYSQYGLAFENTLVINSMNVLIGSVGISKYFGCVSPVYYVFRNTENSDLRYINYIFQNVGFQKELRKYANGILEIRLRISAHDMLRRIVPCPSLCEQKKIADFLDEKCAEIDTVIEKTKATIEEYKKLKQSVITQAITKGIRPNRPMKDSGVEWIGELPADWQMVKTKYVADVNHGTDPKTEGDIPVYGSGAESFKTCGEYKEGPTVLVGRKGATLHIPHYIEGKYWNVDTAFDVKTYPNYSLRYFFYAACCFDYKYFMSQTTLPGMTQSNYNNMIMPFPLRLEQDEIVYYLDKKCYEIDELIAKKTSLLSELESYKKSMIYEYVTGKKEV